MAIALVNGIRMHYRMAGEGPLIVLLHGWPQTGHCWRHLMGPLSEHHTVVAPDLRGYGRTDRPADGYDKRTMADDLHRLVGSLGFGPATVIGHDRGARVAHRWALDHPGDVDRLIVMDIIPTREMWRRMDADLARRTWHWLFHLQPDLPELIDIGAYVRHMIRQWAHVPLPDEDVEEYVRAFSTVGAARAGFADYRAAFPGDAEHDEADAGRRLTMPVRVLWGEHSFLQALDPVAIWGDYAEDVTGTMIGDCGHFLAEERPAKVLEELALPVRP
ncbi:alpha/beta fold hydrolase [Actinomadura sp. HBU206391]|uniref:alpha/beta fold hydrolase n=1 Tax=Actinomadura sp. HBU206391 TaxID=2731692 RepID=UPI0016507857|nr:alpha/beta hydrolase [Actinomadura sp. HBU206391]MBC6460109.1 alpha/beta hydrolase [Actinomadura sp. HBU206391]